MPAPSAEPDARTPAARVSWLSADEQAAWRGLLRMHALLSFRLNQRLSADSDLSMQDYGVLVALSESTGGQLRPSALARELGVEKSRLSHHLERLVDRELVTRERCPTDQRGRLVGITSRGRRALEMAAPGHVEAVREFFVDRLTPAQLSTLASIADAVLEGEPADR
jgi:DNA-binding MarR family transcriptional regulator